MSVGGVGARSNLAIQGLVDMRRQLDDLQRQLGTGKKSANHAGVGADRGLAVGLRAQLSGLASYGQTIALVNMRLDLSQTVLNRFIALRGDAKAALQQSAEIRSGGQSAAQQSARGHLDELLELLNTQAGDRYLFSGRALDRPAVESAGRVLDGDGGRAGLKQVIAERALADLGAAGRGRLDVASAAGTVTLAEDADPSPFGFKLGGVTASLSGATVGSPSGSPPAVTVALAANPNAGESVSFTLDLPDGTQTTLVLSATDAVPPGPGRFVIGPDPDATAANLVSALSTELAKAAKTSLKAASALAAAEDFFNIGAGDPPLRVAGPPFETATALVAGTASDTVVWYTGEMSAAPVRASATARVDASIAVNYGLRADEEGFRFLVQNVAAFAATTFDPNDADTPAGYAALTERLVPAFAGPPGMQRIEDIASDLAGAQITVRGAEERHRQTHSVLSGLLDRIEGVPMEQVAAEILALQTRLQASLQTTSLLYQMRLTDYI